MRRTATPDAQHKEGRLDLHSRDHLTESDLFTAATEGVTEATQRDDSRPPPVREIDGEAILTQQSQPISGRDPSEQDLDRFRSRPAHARGWFSQLSEVRRWFSVSTE